MQARTISWIVFFDVLLFAHCCIPFLMDHYQALEYSPFNYFIQQIFVFGILLSFSKDTRNSFIFSPSFIAVTYINLNFFFGSIVFLNENVIQFLLDPFSKWQYAHIVLVYFNLCNFAILNSFFLSKRIKLPTFRLAYDFKRNGIYFNIAIGLLLILIFSRVEVTLSFLSGVGSFSIIPKSIGALIIFVTVFYKFSLRNRIVWYTAVIFMFAFSAINEKRDAIFLLLPILLLESTKYPIGLNLRTGIFAFVTTAFLGYLILVMSILRGYGGYNPQGFWHASSYVDDYVKSEDFVPMLMNNLEISYTYFHSNNAIETIVEDPNQLSYGSTIVKPLFIPFPRKYFPNKPKSIIELYTTSFSEELRKDGVSWPICFQAELFWNFHFFGIFLGFFIFLIFNSIYKNIVSLIKEHDIINYIPLLYIYQQVLVMFRGSGLDLYLITIILSFGIFILIKTIIRTLRTAPNH